MELQEVTPPVVALVRDLMFGSRIAAEGRAAGVVVRIVRNPADLAAIEGSLLLVDLNQEGAIPAAADWKRFGGKPVTGFVSHVDAETIAAARTAGIDQVVARSQFVQLLPRLLSKARRPNET